MDSLKKIAGFLWMAFGLVGIYLMFAQAGTEIAQAVADNKAVLDTKMFWYVIIPIFTPIMVGMCIFGWYAFKGEFSRIARSSAEL